MDFQINMGIKLQGEGSNLGPPAKPSSDTMLNDQLFLKLKLVRFGFNMNIMLQHFQIMFLATPSSLTNFLVHCIKKRKPQGSRVTLIRLMFLKHNRLILANLKYRVLKCTRYSISDICIKYRFFVHFVARD